MERSYEGKSYFSYQEDACPNQDQDYRPRLILMWLLLILTVEDLAKIFNLA